MLVFKVHNPARISDTDSCRGRFTLANRRREAAISGRNETGCADSRNGTGARGITIRAAGLQTVSAVLAAATPSVADLK